MNHAEKERQYTQSYALNTARGVSALLRDRHRIAERRYRGDTAASDIVIALHSAIESAALTDRQAEAVAWVYGFDLTQSQAARIMGITQQAVQISADAACERIAAVYKRWEYGEIVVTFGNPEGVAIDGEKETAGEASGTGNEA